MTAKNSAAPTEWTTEDVAVQIAAGNVAAESEMAKRYFRWIRLILFKRCKDAELALDLTQQTLLTVLVRLRKRPLDEPAKLDRFIYRTAVNLFVNEARRLSRRQTYCDSERIDKIPTPESSPFDELAREQKSAAIVELIRELPTDRDREVLYRFYISGDEKATICEDLQIGVLHFNRVLYRARGRFRDVMLRRNKTEALRLIDTGSGA